MSEIRPISPLKLSFKLRNECPVSMLHLEIFGDASQRKSQHQKFRARGQDDHLTRYPYLSDEEQGAIVRALHKQIASDGDDT